LSDNDTTTVTVKIYKELTGEPLPEAPFEVKVSKPARLSDNNPRLTDINGQATFTVTNDTTVTVTVTSGKLIQTLKLYFGATLELLPSSINTIDEVKLTALLKDAKNTPLDAQTVTFNFKNSNNETLSPNMVITGADGTAEVTITDLGESFGENRRFDAKTTATVLDINQSATITAQITDNNDLPIAGQTVTFSVLRTDETESQADISPQTGISNNEGEVKAIVSNSHGENLIVTVQADTAKQEIPLYFGAKVSLSPTEAEGIADGDISLYR